VRRRLEQSGRATLRILQRPYELDEGALVDLDQLRAAEYRATLPRPQRL